MKQDTLTFQTLQGDQRIPVTHSDDDIIIIDNIHDLTEPNPTRLQMNFIAICVKGRVQAEVNGQVTVLGENQLLLCPPGTLFSNFLISPDFEFKILFLTNRILQSFLREKMNVWNELMYIYRLHVMTMGELDIKYFRSFYDMLRLCIDTPLENPYREEVIQSILQGALVGLCGTLKRMMPANSSTTPLRQSESLFQKFLNLVADSPVKHQSVEHYAEQLCVSPKYLSAVCKKSSGKTTNEWITEQVMEDIRYCLHFTDLSVKQVSHRLGFANPSFFGKYVREHFGKTPLQLRSERK